MSVYKISTHGYEPFIDFLKGICISWVLFLHTIPCLEFFGVALWAMNAVPLFILIQVIHSYKRGLGNVPRGFLPKVFSRVLLPFFVVQGLTLLVYYMVSDTTTFSVIVSKSLLNGGFGPGSYYPWLYFEIAILIPVFSKILQIYSYNRLKSNFLGGVIILTISMLNEVAFSILNVEDGVWRLWCGRYLFLIWLGYDICREGVCMNKRRWLLSIMSIFCLLVFEYINPNLEPIFYNTGWNLHRWICYFYVAYILLYILFKIYIKINKRILHSIELLGKASYEIFLVQMFVIPFIQHLHLYKWYAIYEYLLQIILSVAISLCLGVCWYRYRLKHEK